MPTLTVTPGGQVQREADETPTGDLHVTNYRDAGAAQVGRARLSGYLLTPDEDPFVPVEVQAALRAKSPRLGLTYNRDLRAFTLLLEWAPGDPRYAIMGTAFPYEVLGTFDPRAIRPAEIPTWLEQRFRMLASGGREDVRRMHAEDEKARAAQDATAQQALADRGKQHVVEALQEATSPTADRIGKRRTVVKPAASAA